METSLRRTVHSRRKRDGLDTLEQRFQFTGPAVTAAVLKELLRTAPLVGKGSVFGDRPGVEVEAGEGSRSLRGFSPAPGFRFDVDLTERAGGFTVNFSQPDRDVPYLQGSFLWLISDDGTDAVLDEQINTAQALEVVDEPLGGSRPSLRRWLFFRAGHKQVMNGAVTNLAALVDRAAT